MALIYIIEDDDSIREIEEFALINAGHKVLGFACAKDFYRRLDDVIPNVTKPVTDTDDPLVMMME